MDNYRTAIEKSGMRVEKVEDNSQYKFISKDAQGASKQYGVKSISLLAVKQWTKTLNRAIATNNRIEDRQVLWL